jgi:F-type H+-transporting ATPase subunit b
VQIDWFTLVAQVINFLILLWLLQRFLYGPIIRTMEAREEKLNTQFETAETRRKEAEEERAALAAEREELAERREELIQKAREEAAERRRHMIHEARQETEELMTRWYDAIEREKQSFLREVQTRMGDQLLHLLRRTLSDLAGVELERAIVGVFLERVEKEADTLAEELTHGTQAATQEAAAGSNRARKIPTVRVRTTFDLPQELETKIRETLAQMLPDPNQDGQSRDDGQNQDEQNQDGQNLDGQGDFVTFVQTDELVCGIEVEVRNRRIAWTIRDYLDTLEQNLDDAILQNGMLQARRNRASYGENGVDEILPG